MGQQRDTQERSRSRPRGSLVRQSDLRTNFPSGAEKCRRPTLYDRRQRAPLTVSSHVKSPKKPQLGLSRYFRRTPSRERDAWGDTRNKRNKQVEQRQYARYERDRRNRRNDTPEMNKQDRRRQRGRHFNTPHRKLANGATVKANKTPKKTNQ